MVALTVTVAVFGLHALFCFLIEFISLNFCVDLKKKVENFNIFYQNMNNY